MSGLKNGRNLLAVVCIAAAAWAAFAAASWAYKPTVKADVGLYPNDFGPDSIDVSAYPPRMKIYYRIFSKKCQACHTIARPINSEFLELTDQEIAKAKKTQPELFAAGPDILKPEAKIWSRYVHRMMAKPGCPVGQDGKKIWQFLVYDSRVRKTGKNFAAWKARRTKLVADFVRLYPKQYKDLLKSGALQPFKGEQ